MVSSSRRPVSQGNKGVRPRRSIYFTTGFPPSKYTRTLRKCLGYCNGEFWSSWPGHRICPACAQKQPDHNTLTPVCKIHKQE